MAKTPLQEATDTYFKCLRDVAILQTKKDEADLELLQAKALLAQAEKAMKDLAINKV